MIPSRFRVGQQAETVDHLDLDLLVGRQVRGTGKAFVQHQPGVDIGQVVAGQQRGQPQVDFGAVVEGRSSSGVRPALSARTARSSRSMQRLKPISWIWPECSSQEFFGTADLQVVGRQGEAGPQVFHRRDRLQALLGIRGHDRGRRGDQVGIGAVVGALEAQAALIDDAKALLRRSPGQFDGLVELRGRTEKIDPHRTPWEQGYQIARTLRHRLGLGDNPQSSDMALARAFWLPSVRCVSVNDPSASKLFEAMVDPADGERPGFLTTKSRPEQVRFSFCRGLFEYLTAPGTPSALVTVARTDRQKRNRAFAAEFLAPAAWIRERIDGTQVSPDEMDDWAQELGMSTLVVGHQIENHRLADVAGF